MPYEENASAVTYSADSTLGVYTGPQGVRGSSNPGPAVNKLVMLGGADRQVTLATGAATTRVVGVCRNKPQKVGAPVNTAIFGVVVVIADGAVVRGNAVYASLAKPGFATATASANTQVVGTAVESATDAGKFSIQLSV